MKRKLVVAYTFNVVFCSFNDLPSLLAQAPADRVADLDINDYSRNMFGVPFSEATASQKAGGCTGMYASETYAPLSKIGRYRISATCILLLLPTNACRCGRLDAC